MDLDDRCRRWPRRRRRPRGPRARAGRRARGRGRRPAVSRWGHGHHRTNQRRVFGLRSSDSAHRNAPASEAVSPELVEGGRPRLRGLDHPRRGRRPRRRGSARASPRRAPRASRASARRAPSSDAGGSRARSSSASAGDRPLAVEPPVEAPDRAQPRRRGWRGRSRGTGSAGPRAPPSRVRSQLRVDLRHERRRIRRRGAAAGALLPAAAAGQRGEEQDGCDATGARAFTPTLPRTAEISPAAAGSPRRPARRPRGPRAR